MTRLLQGITTPVQAHVCYGYARVVKDKRPNPLYAEVLELLAATPVQGISLEYEQPGHSPDLLRHCGSKHVILGLLDMSREAPESAAHIAARLRAAMRVVAPERLHPASDCGMWHLPRPTAFARLCALADATREVKAELGAAG